MRRGSVYVAGQFVLFAAIAVAPRFDHADWPWAVRIPGLVLAFAGLVLLVWAIRRLGPAMTAMPEPRPQVPVAKDGPYRFVRHPVYVAVLAICLGASLARATWVGVLLTVVLALLFDLKARYEERLLHADPSYRAYAEQTPSRFLPRIY
jgi:protein-S-isoprenylcysteine O-methyltransferase Ste14